MASRCSRPPELRPPVKIGRGARNRTLSSSSQNLNAGITPHPVGGGTGGSRTRVVLLDKQVPRPLGHRSVKISVNASGRTRTSTLARRATALQTAADPVRRLMRKKIWRWRRRGRRLPALNAAPAPHEILRLSNNKKSGPAGSPQEAGPLRTRLQSVAESVGSGRPAPAVSNLPIEILVIEPGAARHETAGGRRPAGRKGLRAGIELTFRVCNHLRMEPAAVAGRLRETVMYSADRFVVSSTF